MNTTKAEKTVKQLLIGKCWNYLFDNFHKFHSDHRLKIALELCKKDVAGDKVVTPVTVNVMPVIELKDGSPLEYNIGNRPVAINSRLP